MNANEYLNKVANIVEKTGYVKSNSTSDTPTYVLAMDEACDSRYNTIVEDALEWLKGLETSNKYEIKLKKVCLKEDLSYSELPFAASLIPTYNRYLKNKEEESDLELLKESSEYAGEIGDKIELDIVNTEEKSIMTRFGPTSIYTMIDIFGNYYVWVTSYGNLFNPTKIKGTVKKHQVYEGIKQTVLTRVKQLG